jgi:hypothetical protein
MTPISKEPWELYPHLWKSQPAFFTYLRGGIRLIWSRYPAKLDWKKKQLTTERPEGYTGRGKSFGKCHYCGGMFTGSALEVDHVEQAGTCNSWETAFTFIKNLLDCNDNWVLACKPCHKIKSYAEKEGLTFAEAAILKKVIAIEKLGTKKVLDICVAHGYSTQSLRNADKRREALISIYTQE